MTQHHIEPHGGYALTNLKEAGGEESLRFEGIVTLHGKKLMHVSNGGTGGSHRYQAVTDDYTAFRAALNAFEAYATEWNKDNEFAGIEDSDQLINRLIEVATLNRLRNVPFVLDDMDFWETGEYHQFGNPLTREQVITVLSGPEYAPRRPRVWDREAGDFVPVGEVITERIYREVR